MFWYIFSNFIHPPYFLIIWLKSPRHGALSRRKYLMILDYWRLIIWRQRRKLRRNIWKVDLINRMDNVLRDHSQHFGVNPWLFQKTVKTIASTNTKSDLKEMFQGESHFDSETFAGGSKWVKRRYEAAMESLSKWSDDDQARRTFGEMSDTFQVRESSLNFVFFTLLIHVNRISLLIQIWFNWDWLLQVMDSVKDLSEKMTMLGKRREHAWIVKGQLLRLHQISMKIFERKSDWLVDIFFRKVSLGLKANVPTEVLLIPPEVLMPLAAFIKISSTLFMVIEIIEQSIWLLKTLGKLSINSGRIYVMMLSLSSWHWKRIWTVWSSESIKHVPLLITSNYWKKSRSVLLINVFSWNLHHLIPSEQLSMPIKLN